jgi:hypothetical protein
VRGTEPGGASGSQRQTAAAIRQAGDYCSPDQDGFERVADRLSLG